MKAYQNNKNSNLVRRETVASGERASDIKSRIMGWGCQKDDKVILFYMLLIVEP